MDPRVSRTWLKYCDASKLQDESNPTNFELCHHTSVHQRSPLHSVHFDLTLTSTWRQPWSVCRRLPQSFEFARQSRSHPPLSTCRTSSSSPCGTARTPLASSSDSTRTPRPSSSTRGGPSKWRICLLFVLYAVLCWCSGHLLMACTRLRECCRQVEAEVVSKSRNTLHQTTYKQ